MDPFDSLRILLWMAYAMALAGVVGMERELKQRPAGLRTHMLVAGASALLVGMGDLVVRLQFERGSEGLSIDPLRLVEAVVAGVAFIGAGTIFSARGRESVAGITTAASLLAVAVIGMVAGYGYWLLALLATLLTLAVLSLLRWFERRVLRAADQASDRD